MMLEPHISRRSFMVGSGLAAAFPLLPAMQTSPLHSLEALLQGAAMVRISPGEFIMGSESGLDDEDPLHRVRITKGFEIGKTEVTQAQWSAVMTEAHAPQKDASASETPTRDAAAPSLIKGATLPVENISWNDVQQFLYRLNVRDDKYRYRLPTEAEWEYCCKAGKSADQQDRLGDVAWYKANSEETVHPVGEKSPNAWGLHDMLGNAAEWVQDWYAPEYYSQSPEADPQGPPSGSYRVLRGGRAFDMPKYCRASARAFDFPINRLHYAGFRVVRTPK